MSPLCGLAADYLVLSLFVPPHVTVSRGTLVILIDIFVLRGP